MRIGVVALVVLIATFLFCLQFLPSSNSIRDSEVASLHDSLYVPLIQGCVPATAREETRNLLQIGKARSDDRLVGRALLRMAFLDVLDKQNPSEWMPKLENAKQLIGNHPSVAKSEFLLVSGVIKGGYQGLHEQGISDLHEAISIAQALSEDRVLLLSKTMAAQLLIRQGQEQEALRMSLTAVCIAEALDDSAFLEFSLSRTLCHFLQCEMESQVVDLAHKLKRIDPQNCDQADLVLCKVGESTDYLGYAENTIKSLTVRPEKTTYEWARLGRTHCILSELYRKNGQLNLAIDNLVLAPSCFANAQSPNEQLSALVRSAELYIEAGNLEKAKKCVDHFSVDMDQLVRCHSADRVLGILESLGAYELATKWSVVVDDRKKVVNANGIMLVRDIVNKSWNAELLGRQMKKNALSRVQQSQLRTTFAAIGLILIASFAGVIIFRYKLLKASRDQLESLVEERTQEIRKALETAELATKSKREFLARANHEIRSPLQAIVGYSELLHPENNLTDEAKSTFVEGILASSEHLMNLVNDVIEVSKIEDGSFQTTPRNFLISNLVKSLRNIYGESAEKRSVDLTIDESRCQVNAVCGDETALRQILLNLISNGIRSAENGFVRVFIESDIVRRNVVQFSARVEDSGPGIPEQYREQVFEPFAVFHSPGAGKGLGLHITKSLVTLLGGDIQFESEPGKNTTFYFNLQLRLPENVTTSVVSQGRVPGLKILIIDDKKTIRDLVRIQLEQLGHDSRSCETMDDAVEIVGSWSPDFVLLDLRMPGNNGFELLEHLREQFDDLPTMIAMTGDATLDVKRSAFVAGFDGFLSKPFQKGQLHQILVKFRGKSSLEKPLRF